MADDDLAYGDYHGQGGEAETDRGFLGDTFKKFTGRARPQDQGQSVRTTYLFHTHLPSPRVPKDPSYLC